jgi:hypothetical protein
MPIINLVDDPSSETPDMAMGTGGVVNNSAQLYTTLPDIAGPESTWTVTEWNQNSYLNPTDMETNDSSYADSLLDNPLYTWTNDDRSVALNVYSEGDNGAAPYVYGLEQKNTNSGNDLFLSTNINTNQIYTFANPITYSLTAKLSEATTIDGNSANPALVQVFTGFVATFNSPGNPNYNPGLPTIPAFIQIALSSSTDEDNRYLNDSKNEIIYTYTIPGDPSLPFASSNAAPIPLSYNLNAYLEDMIAHNNALLPQASDLSLWSLSGMYLGSELGAVGSQATSSSSALDLQISNLSLTDNTSQTVTYSAPSTEALPAFDASAIVASASAAIVFNEYFGYAGNIAAGSLIYNGTGSPPSASASLKQALVITAGSSTRVPEGFKAIYDLNTGDSINLSQGTSASAVFLAGNTEVVTDINGPTIYANGNDTISGGAGTSTVYGGAGALTFIGGSGSVDLFGGTGDVTASLQTGAGSLTGGTGSASTTFFGGSTNCTLRAGSGSGPSTLVGGSGVTTEYGNGSGPVEFVAGVNGTTIMAGQFGTGSESFFTAKNTNAIMALNGADDTVVGGTGSSTVIAGSGHDVFGFLNGFADGNETIYGLKDTDALVYGGYAGDPVLSERVISGSDVITLIDHTVIKIVGVDHTIY